MFVKICLSIFLFDVWDMLWVLIRLVPEVSLLISLVCQNWIKTMIHLTTVIISRIFAFYKFCKDRALRKFFLLPYLEQFLVEEASADISVKPKIISKHRESCC